MQNLARPTVLRAVLGAGEQRAGLPVQSHKRRVHDVTLQPDPHMDQQPGTYEKVDMPQVLIVRKKGHDVISDPLYNKGAVNRWSAPLARRLCCVLRPRAPRARLHQTMM
jgi:hypothetical protein